MSQDSFEENPNWNEFQWESHLNEIEKKSEQLRRFITSAPHGNLPRWKLLLEDSFDELDAVESYIEEELLMDEAYFPDDEDFDDDEDDFDDDDLFFQDSIFGRVDDEDDEYFDYGEEWKELSEDYIFSDYGSIENFVIYITARDLAVDVLKWAESVPVSEQKRVVHEFINQILTLTAKLAGGYSFGFEQDVLGGNIAYTKKALYASNDALTSMQKLKSKHLFRHISYKGLHNRLFELRNDIGVYVQELRDRFTLGLE